MLLRHRRKVVGLSVIVALGMIGLALLSPPTYTARASFMPQASESGGQLSRFSGVASQFGVDVPSGEAGQSPQFYAELLTSPRILRSTVRSEYSVVGEGDTITGNLIDHLDIEAETSMLALERAVRALEEKISVSTGRETGIVELSISTGSSALSEQIGRQMVDMVNRFNLEVRQSQAGAQAEFVENRLEQARRELRTAEDSLERFLERNRSFQNSPTLRFEHQRLQRQVELKQQVYSSLATRYEEAQINRVRDTPVITVVTPPVRPASPDSRSLPVKGLLGLLLGGVGGVLWAFGAEFGRNARVESRNDYEEFASLWEETRQEFLGLGRRLYRFGDLRED